jgi:hypothetical protein
MEINTIAVFSIIFYSAIAIVEGNKKNNARYSLTKQFLFIFVKGKGMKK